MLVCRLDAPTPETVRRMITDSLAAEKDGLTGLAYIDARGITDTGYMEGDQWLFALADGRAAGTARRWSSTTAPNSFPTLIP